MAKMFYTLQEAAERLKASEDKVKQYSDEGRLQQFRDGDKLMFKREQVDNIAGDSAAEAEATLVDDDLDDSNIKLAEDSRAGGAGSEGSSTDAINLDDTSEQTAVPERDSRDDSATATGVSVFDADEADQADPAAQTQVTDSTSIGREQDEEDLSLDSAGSGSGLLDLTRESDDTSLGAVELLEDEGTKSGGTSMRGSTGSASSSRPSSGIFESAGGVESPAAYEEEEEPAPAAAYGSRRRSSDAAGDGFAGGLLAGVFCVLIIAVLVVGNAVQGISGRITQMIASQWLYAVIALAAGCLIFGLIGWAIGRSRA